MTKHEKWTFVVETNGYAGDFERALCLYVTGYAGEYASGGDYDKYRALFLKEHGREDDADIEMVLFADLVAKEPVEHNGHYWSDYCEMDPDNITSVRIFLDHRPDQEELDTLKKRALAFPAARRKVEGKRDRLKVTGFHLLKTTITTEELPA